MKITLKDIAKEAGVSQATISRIVNGNAAVSYTLEQKVFQAAKELGVEIPKKDSQQNSKHIHSNVIGLLVADLSNPYFFDILRGVISEAKLIDYGVQIFETNEDVQSEEETFQTIGHFNLNGLILCASRISDSRLLNFYHQYNLPMVLVNRYVKDPTICCITVDYHKSMYQAATHLINLGHKRIAYLSGPSKSDTSLKRRSGIVDALIKAELKLDPDLCPGSFPNTEGGFQVMISLLALPEWKRPTAVLAYNDLIAIGALRAIRMKGLKVPEDISIIGVDNIDITSHTFPPSNNCCSAKSPDGIISYAHYSPYEYR